MSEVLTLGLVCLAASLLGAVLGGALIWWMLRGRTVARQEVAPRPSAPTSPTALPQLRQPPQVPVMRPEPGHMKEAVQQAVQEEAIPELTDEEVDAMLPELPASSRPPKRIMTAPKKPTFHRL
jgi:hypothetical protein